MRPARFNLSPGAAGSRQGGATPNLILPWRGRIANPVFMGYPAGARSLFSSAATVPPCSSIRYSVRLCRQQGPDRRHRRAAAPISSEHMPSPHPPIPVPDYQRIFRVLKTVADAVGPGHARASAFLSLAGAHLIEKHYKKKCQPVAGAASFRMDDAGQSVVSLFDQPAADGHGEGAGRGFHCWIVCEGYVIDFMAPLFVDYLRERGHAGRVSRKMFQKPIEAMVDSPLLMNKPGDFYMLPDVALTRDVFQRLAADEDCGDLVQICMQWYKKPPREMPRRISLQDAEGTVSELQLVELALDGVW